MPSSSSATRTLAALLFSLSLFFSLFPSISSHAVLITPLPYNTNPTKTGPCGVSSISPSMQNNPSATWTKGQSVTIRWNLVASDGGGNVIGEFDPNGGTNFTVQAWDSETFETAGSNKFYNKTFIVPQTLDCSRSPTGFCTFRVRSVTNWFSCSTVKICGSDCVAPPPAPKVCTQTTTLPFCSNSTSVSISEGSSVSDIDSSLSLVYSANLDNPLVFATPDNAECKSSYKTLLCGLSLPSCNPSTGSISSGACKSQCKQTMKACSVKQEHIDLYQCDTLPECDDQLKASKKGGMSPGGAAALSIFLIALVGALAFAGFMYYKKGHLFGYAFDKHEKRIVKFQSNPHNYTAYEDSL